MAALTSDDTLGPTFVTWRCSSIDEYAPCLLEAMRRRMTKAPLCRTEALAGFGILPKRDRASEFGGKPTAAPASIAIAPVPLVERLLTYTCIRNPPGSKLRTELRSDNYAQVAKTLKNSSDKLDWNEIMPRKRRKYPLRRSSEARKEQILAAAILLFGRDGYHRTTVQDVAREADVSVGLIYQYFQDKEDLLFAAIGDIFDVYNREIPLAVARHADPLAQFKAAIQTYCRIVDEHRGAALLGYRESRSLPRDKIKATMRKELQSTSLIADCIKRCIATKAFHPVNVDVLTYQIVVFAHSWALNAWRLPRLTREQYVEDGLKIILQPVLAKPAKR